MRVRRLARRKAPVKLWLATRAEAERVISGPKTEYRAAMSSLGQDRLSDPDVSGQTLVATHTAHRYLIEGLIRPTNLAPVAAEWRA